MSKIDACIPTILCMYYCTTGSPWSMRRTCVGIEIQQSSVEFYPYILLIRLQTSSIPARVHIF